MKNYIECETCRYNRCHKSAECLKSSWHEIDEYIDGVLWTTRYAYRYSLWKPKENFLKNNLLEDSLFEI